jgi:hypoxanthine phosphoribosyltransferase
LRILITKDELEARVEGLACEITKEYEGMRPVLICVLKGAVLFVADLVRCMPFDLEMEFMAVASYGKSTESSGVVRILKDLETDIEGRHALLVEDVIDSGLTLQYLTRSLRARNPASLEVVTLLSKPSRRKAEFKCRYTGFEIPDQFVVGYGLDWAEKYRNLPYIGVADESD